MILRFYVILKNFLRLVNINLPILLHEIKTSLWIIEIRLRIFGALVLVPDFGFNQIQFVLLVKEIFELEVFIGVNSFALELHFFKLLPW